MTTKDIDEYEVIALVNAERDGGRYVLYLGHHMEMRLSYGLATQIVRCLQQALEADKDSRR